MKKFLLSLTLFVLLLGIGYSYGIGFYAEKFHANTDFGNIDISNLTLSEATDKIEENLKSQEISLTENGAQLGSVTIGDLNPEINTQEVLTEIYNSQNPNMWIESYFGSDAFDNQLYESINLDSGQLRHKLEELGLTNADRQPAQSATIDYTEASGYFVTESRPGNQLDYQALETLITQSIQAGQDQVEINTAYLQPEIESDDEVISELMAEIEELTQIEITLNIAGNLITIPQKEIENWLYFDESNQVVFDQNFIYDYLGELNDKYATYDDTRQFQSTLEGVVTVEPGTLGWSIDRDAETLQIVEDLHNGEDVQRDPVIVGTGYNTTDSNDIGTSYVEVSIDAQHMWVYKDGQVVVDTPIVTGQIGTDTVAGAYSVWNKEEDAQLTGFNPRRESDYTQPVEYWIPFDDTGQGIHDANWQSSFGGDTYLHAGSLGCINTPPDIMPAVYEAIELGMPVIVH